jgi:hypothetical protein
VDGSAARAAQRHSTWDDGGGGQRGREGTRTWWHGVLTRASDGVDGGVGDDGGVAHSDTRSAAHVVRQAAGCQGGAVRTRTWETARSGRQHVRRGDAGAGGREAAAVRTDARGPDSAFNARRTAQARGSHEAMAH